MTRRALRALVIAAFAACPVVAACGGQTISIGSNQADLSKVDPSKFTSNIGSCPEGYQHPNICCEGGKNTASTCGAYLDAPFHPCDSGWTTYPNAAACCALADPSKCMAPTNSGLGLGGTSCSWTCPPGWWPEGATKSETPPCDPLMNGGQCGSGSSGSSGACCQLLSSGGTVCQNWGAVTPVADKCGTASLPPDIDASALDGGAYDGAVPADAGVGNYDAGTFDCDAGSAYDAGTGYAPNCACPEGFNATTAEPDVCCSSAPDGTSVCFSIANGGPSPNGGNGNGQPPSGTGNPGMPPTGYSCGGTAGTSGSPATCSCQGATSSKKETMDCAGTPVTCTCSVDGTVTASFLSAAADCSSADWAKCGF